MKLYAGLLAWLFVSYIYRELAVGAGGLFLNMSLETNVCIRITETGAFGQVGVPAD